MNSNLNLITETSFSLQGKKILITGATSGIGRQVAIDCARFGAQLILSARSEERMEEVMAILDGDSHSSILGDLTEPETIKRIVSSIDSVDGIVLCAGIGKTLPFKFCTRDNFDEVYEVNFFSQLELLRNLVRGKHISKNASVVFMSSIGGLNVFTPGNIIYGSSKAALDSAMKFCALELAPNIRVNSIMPGMINTSLIKNRSAFSSEQLANDIKKYPLGRYGETDDISSGVIFLLSAASKLITGQTLVIDGGRTLL